jgi:hypothetical protein
MIQSEGNSSPGRHESAADEPMKALTRLFSAPNRATQPHFRCSIDGPTELNMFFESILDEVFGRDPNSLYKCWVRQLYRLGFISTMPSEWTAPEDAEKWCLLRPSCGFEQRTEQSRLSSPYRRDAR